MWKKAIVFMSAFCALLSSSQVTYAETMRSTAPSADIIVGQVRFEPRYTKTVQEDCRFGYCQPNHTSEIYWQMTIVSGNKRYVLNRQFNIGNPRSPESISLGEILVRPGTVVQLEGSVSPLSDESYLITEIDNMSLLMDTQ